MLRLPRRVLSPDSYGFWCCSSSSFSFRQLPHMSSSPPKMKEPSPSSRPMPQTAKRDRQLFFRRQILKCLDIDDPSSGDKGKSFGLGASVRSASQVAALKTNMAACKEETLVVIEHDKSRQGKSNREETSVVTEHAAEPSSSAFEPEINECMDGGSQTKGTMESISKGQFPVLPTNASASPEDIISTTKCSEQKKYDGSSVSYGSVAREMSQAKRSKFNAQGGGVTSSAGRVSQGSSSCTTEYSVSDETNSMMNELERCSLPTEFGKKTAPRPTRSDPRHPNSNPQVWRKKGSNGGMKTPRLPPFDICQSESVSSSLADVSFSMDGEEDHQSCRGSEAETSRILRPGMVLLKGYLSLDKQHIEGVFGVKSGQDKTKLDETICDNSFPWKKISIVRECRSMGVRPGGFYQPGYKGGAKIRLMMMCLGLDWDPQSKKYGKKRRVDNARPPKIPPEFHDIVKRAMTDSQTLTQQQFEASDVDHILPDMSPDICIVNFYNTTGRLGLHQDRDESRESLAKGLPVVSISVGDSAEFLYGENRDITKAEKVVLESGDVLIFGGKSRHIFHGVNSIIPDSAPQSLLNETGLRPGRLNLTFRQF